MLSLKGGIQANMFYYMVTYFINSDMTAAAGIKRGCSLVFFFLPFLTLIQYMQVSCFVLFFF